MWLNPTTASLQIHCQNHDARDCARGKTCRIIAQVDFRRQIGIVCSKITQSDFTAADVSKVLDFCDIFQKIFEHEYWTRVWTVQEVALSGEKTLIFGELRLHWNEVWLLLLALSERKHEARDFSPPHEVRQEHKARQSGLNWILDIFRLQEGGSRFRHLLKGFRRADDPTIPYPASSSSPSVDPPSADSLIDLKHQLRRLEVKMPSAVKFHIRFAYRIPGLDAYHTFYKILLECMDTNCTDPRDKVYGLIALAPPNLNFRADYALSTCDVFNDAYRQLCVPRSRFEESWYLKRVSVLIQTLGIGPLGLLYGYKQNSVQLVQVLQAGRCSLCGVDVTFNRMQPYLHKSGHPDICLLVCLDRTPAAVDTSKAIMSPASQHAMFYATRNVGRIVLAVEARFNATCSENDTSSPIAQLSGTIPIIDHERLSQKHAMTMICFHQAWSMSKLRNDEDEQTSRDPNALEVGQRLPFKAWSIDSSPGLNANSCVTFEDESVSSLSRMLLPEMFVEPGARSRFLEAFHRQNKQ